MTKLIIQIPCFNEEQTLSQTLADLPQTIPGCDLVEVLVIDDGSTDRTVEVAREGGVKQFVQLPRNRGLAAAFSAGMNRALELGADVIVNTDGDHQYPGRFIPDLVRPILEGMADVVVGDRQISTRPGYPRLKRWLQTLGSRVVGWTSGQEVPDATSGFRAFSQEAALRVVVHSSYTYTAETLIQAGKTGLAVKFVPIEVNDQLRESRLIKSMPAFVARSAAAILRIFLMYESLRVFVGIGAALELGGMLLAGRYVYFYAIGEGQGHVQSLILATILLLMGFLSFLLGMLADLIAKNRRLSEEALYRLRKLEMSRNQSV
jgi:glycosyltransferase involved in cell wall biosynthesis